MEHNHNWHGVPLEFVASWRSLFNTASKDEGAHLQAPCPVCGQRLLHRYYALEKYAPRELRGMEFKGPGSYWEWCSACHSFEHMHGNVPGWWTDQPLDIDPARLTAIPDLLDEAMTAKCRFSS